MKVLATINVIGIGVTCIIGGIIFKKLNDVHEEIIHFEDAKGVYCKKTYKRLDDEYWKKIL